MQVVQLRGGNPGGVVVPPALARAIASEMLHGRGQPAKLIAACAGGGHDAGQMHIIARPLQHPPPARIARHVHHGRESPVDASRGRLSGDP